MTLDVKSISGSPGESIPFDLSAEFASIAPAEAGIAFAGPVSVSGSAVNIGEGIFEVTAVVTAKWLSECSRCLSPVTVPIKTRLCERFVKSPAPEDDSYLFSDDALDLNLFVRDGLLLALPSQVLCGPSCRGFCPRCGQNLNINPHCSCESALSADPRLAALSALLNDDDEEV
ncbi:MAG: YceD family protein [Christensenellales bacterium]|jgi:uncharacterized protein